MTMLREKVRRAIIPLRCSSSPWVPSCSFCVPPLLLSRRRSQHPGGQLSLSNFQVASLFIYYLFLENKRFKSGCLLAAYVFFQLKPHRQETHLHSCQMDLDFFWFVPLPLPPARCALCTHSCVCLAILRSPKGNSTTRQRSFSPPHLTQTHAHTRADS